MDNVPWGECLNNWRLRFPVPQDMKRIFLHVTQKTVMFSGTVRDNVLFGESNAVLSDDNVWEALSLAQAMEFVEKMPDKLDESIDRGGTNISCGQKQRLSIARALARKPEILVFDP